MKSRGTERQVVLFVLCVCVCQSGAETLRYSLAEEMERDSFVANIAKDLGVSPSQLASRKARVVSEGNEQYFRLNLNTGVLTVKETLDREVICPQSDICTLFFKIFFENPVQLIRGEMEVRDVNDNSPVFPEKKMVLEILETASPGSRFPLERARDKDVGSNGLQNYSLGSNSHFSLALGTGKGGAKYPELILQRQLDREQQREVNLLLTATDGGTPPKSGMAQVRIVVLDANDNIPVFSREVYEARVAENSPPEQLVVRVTAADPDEGSYGRVRYAFTQTSERSRQLFELNAATGEIRVSGNLDFEEVESHEMVVKATDGGGLSAHCKVHVEVLDMNDNAPEIALTSLTASIPEDAPPRTVVALFSVRDRDSGDNGRTECAIDGDLPFSLTPTFDNYYEQLDREQQREVNLLLSATDGGSPPRSGTAQVRIVVLDANDNIPVFSREVYEVRVAENSPPEQLVVRVAAADPDEGSYGRVRYAFTQTSERSRQLFELNAATGEIRVSGNLDFEETKKHKLVVRATDGGGLSAHCKVHVEVLDVNDNAPEIVLTSLTASIPEDAPPRTVVALFSVRDRDSGDNGRTECAIDGDLPFSLTPTFDNYYELRTNAALDRERTAEYNITITAMDWGRSRLSSRERIFVQISDVNDNPPEFTQDVYTISVKENNTPMLRIGKVNATDADAGKNSRVSYALVREKGKEQTDVSINSENGDVYILRPLDYEEVRAFEVTVRAADGGSPALSAEALLRVLLAPRSAEPGALVAKVVAVDADAGQNAWLSYELAKATEPGLFRVGLHSGEVRTARAVTERDAPRHRLVVLVRDRGQPPRSATATLAIALVDGFSEAHLRVSEEAPAADPDGRLTLYLIICLACVSVLFLATAAAAVFVKVRRARQSMAGSLPTFPKSAAESSAGSLPRSYVYDICFSAGTVNSEFRFLRPLFPCFPAGLPHGPGDQRSSLLPSSFSH
uniref:Protocadherin gamma-C3 n=1 Tax=Anser cygnoides TaxID=8845 RepID=A0A8B9DZN8_ANSCY